MTERDTKRKSKFSAFGVLIFVVALVTLTLAQAAGFGAYSGFLAGVVAGLAAVLGSLMFSRSSNRTAQ